MNIAKITLSLMAACVLCFGASVSAFADEPLEVPPSDPAEAVAEEEPIENEEEQTEAAAPDVFVLDEPIDVVVVDVIDDSPVYTVWDKPFNEYQPTEAFTFLLVVFMMLAGMVKFISWAWL